MSRPLTLSIQVLEIPVLSVTGPVTVIDSLLSAEEVCRARIPGFTLHKKRTSGNRLPLVVRFVHAQIPSVAACKRGEMTIEGEGAMLTPAIWCELILTLSARTLQRKGYFYLDASSVANGERLMAFAGLSGSGAAAAACFLRGMGVPILSTGVCLIDSEMHFLCGTRTFVLQNYFVQKYFASRLGDNDGGRLHDESYGETLGAVSSAILRRCKSLEIYHLFLHEDPGEPREIIATKEKMVLSSHLLSRYTNRAASIPPMRLILPASEQMRDFKIRTRAITAMAGLRHYKLYCRLDDLHTLFDGIAR